MSLSKPFILYCKDKSLKDSFGVSEDDFCHYALQLADVLNSCGGIDCSVDLYEEELQQNWSLWTENKIRECTPVIMVCSPQLFHSFTLSGGKQLVEMYKGSFYNDCVVNCIAAPKFVPVFLNECRPNDLQDWLPSQLHAGQKFCLSHLREFHELLYPKHQTASFNRNKLVSDNLELPKFHEIAKLVLFLRGENQDSRPESPIIPGK